MKRIVWTAAIVAVLAWTAGCGPKNGGINHGGNGGGGGGGGVGPDGEPLQEVSEKAKATFDSAVESFNTHKKAKDWTPDICSDLAKQFQKASDEQDNGLIKALYNIGVVWQECDEHKKAFEAFDAVIQHDKKVNGGKGTYPPPIIQKGTYKLALYVKDQKPGDLAEAKKYFEEAIDVGGGLHISLVDAYVNIAMIQRMEAKGDKKKWDEALKNLQRALVIDSKSLEAFLQMAELYREMAKGDKDDSKLDLATLVLTQAQLIEAEKGTPYAPLNLTLGLMKIDQGDIIGGLKNFKAAFEKDAKLYEAYVNYGAITIGFRGYEDAEVVFETALQLEPNDYDAHLNLGVAKRGLEKFPEAEAEYLKAIEIDPAKPDAYFNIGLLYQDYWGFEKAGESGYDHYQVAMKWYKDFKVKAGAKDAYKDKVAEADARIKNCENSIAMLKEAAALMAEAAAITSEPEPAPEPGPATEPAPTPEGGGEAKEGDAGAEKPK